MRGNDMHIVFLRSVVELFSISRFVPFSIGKVPDGEVFVDEFVLLFLVMIVFARSSV